MKTLIAALAAALTLSLAGCAVAEPSAGVVTERDYDPPRLTKPKKSADWDITIRQDADGKTIEYDVTHAIYDKCSIGERWPDCKK